MSSYLDGGFSRSSSRENLRVGFERGRAWVGARDRPKFEGGRVGTGEVIRGEVDTELGGVAPETSGRSEGGVDVSGACRALPSEALGPETEA